MVLNDEITRIDVGPHRVVREADDLVALYFGATPTEAEMQALVEGQIRVIGGRSPFLLLDFSKVEAIPAPARRVVGQAATRVNFKGVAMYGARFQIRVVAKLINGALTLFRRQGFPQAFYDTRDEALAWIESLRNQKTGAE